MEAYIANIDWVETSGWIMITVLFSLVIYAASHDRAAPPMTGEQLESTVAKKGEAGMVDGMVDGVYRSEAWWALDHAAIQRERMDRLANKAKLDAEAEKAAAIRAKYFYQNEEVKVAASGQGTVYHTLRCTSIRGGKIITRKSAMRQNYMPCAKCGG